MMAVIHLFSGIREPASVGRGLSHTCFLLGFPLVNTCALKVEIHSKVSFFPPVFVYINQA